MGSGRFKEFGREDVAGLVGRVGDGTKDAGGKQEGEGAEFLSTRFQDVLYGRVFSLEISKWKDWMKKKYPQF